MKGYWLVIGTAISDPETQAEYGRLWKPTAEKYQARINPLPMLLHLYESSGMLLTARCA